MPFQIINYCSLEGPFQSRKKITRAQLFGSYLEEGMEPREAFVKVEENFAMSEPQESTRVNLNHVVVEQSDFVYPAEKITPQDFDIRLSDVVYHDPADWFSNRYQSTRSQLFEDLKLLNWFTPEEAYEATVCAFNEPAKDDEYIFVWLDEKNLQLAGKAVHFHRLTELSELSAIRSQSSLSTLNDSLQDLFHDFSEICIPAYHLINDQTPLERHGHPREKIISSRPQKNRSPFNLIGMFRN